MSSTPTFFEIPEKSNKQHLSELYFKAVGEKEVLRRELEKDPYSNDQVLIEYVQVGNLVDNLREVLGTVVLTVP